MQAQAISRYTRVTPRKARQVVELIRKKAVGEALNILAFTKKRAAGELAKVLKAAVSNAGQNTRIDVDKLMIKSIQVDGGPMMRNTRRFIPRAMGRASAIHKRTSHIKVVVSDEAKN
ncbi:MAG TPA: 50S ribosomal protein L22 [bacterium]|jgi:large subunit ribosomal protein L22|nr:50S ribosomal protein L22 [bacterium]